MPRDGDRNQNQEVVRILHTVRQHDHMPVRPAWRGAGILAKLFLSEKLAEFMKYTGPLSRGFTTKRVASRAAVNKKMWAYFKKHGLQHKSDGRIITLNDKLKRLFGTTRHEIHGFKDLPKLLKKHLKM